MLLRSQIQGSENCLYKTTFANLIVDVELKVMKMLRCNLIHGINKRIFKMRINKKMYTNMVHVLLFVSIFG